MAGRRAGLLAMTAVALGAAVLNLASILAVLGGDPTRLLVIGADYSDRRVQAYAVEHLGSDVALDPGPGHDGKFYFILAMDPLLTWPERNADLLDFPAYRAQRILVPALAAPWRLLNPRAVVWAFLIMDVLAFGLGAWATGRLAGSVGLSPWWGLLFVVDVGLWYELLIGGPGIVALALSMLGLSWVEERRWVAVSVALATAVLAKETMVALVLGAALYLLVRRRATRAAIAVVTVPVVVATGWAGYVWWRLGVSYLAGSPSGLGLPFGGVAGAWPDWFPARDIDGAVGVLVLTLVALSLVLAGRRPSLMTWAGAGVSVLLLMVGSRVWSINSDLTRAAAPLLVLVPLAIVTPGVSAGGGAGAALPLPDRPTGAG